MYRPIKSNHINSNAEIRVAANRRSAKKRVQNLIETLFLVSSFVLAESVALRNPLQRKAAIPYL